MIRFAFPSIDHHQHLDDDGDLYQLLLCNLYAEHYDDILMCIDIDKEFVSIKRF